VARKRTRPESRKARILKARAKKAMPTLAQVCRSPSDYLGKLDIAALNLMCAAGLPHAENLDVARLLHWIDKAAEKVEFDTHRHCYRFGSSPETYRNSPGYYCCYFLLQTLQEDFGVRYNPARINDPTFQDPKCLNPEYRDSRDLFIHGAIDGPGGTCASIPVLYVAVGRRLGYPLKLVEAKAHLFFRWDNRAASWKNPYPKLPSVVETFNVEGATYIGSHPDDFYENWPEPLTPAEKAAGYYLKSLSPIEELAAFLITRGECLRENGRIEEAIQAYRWASDLVPQDARYRHLLHSTSRAYHMTDEQAYQYAMELSRQNQQRRNLIQAMGQPQAMHPITAPYGDSCQCLHCRQARLASGRHGHPGHHPMCGCIACRPPHVANVPRTW
jgi:tetratricopeptide (TPR) repeat protein